jgi:hypothetical protein
VLLSTLEGGQRREGRARPGATTEWVDLSEES